MAVDDRHHAAGQSLETAGTRTDRHLLEFLVCPVSKSRLTYDAVRLELLSERARLAYPIRDGVPLMTVESARRLDEPA